MKLVPSVFTLSWPVKIFDFAGTNKFLRFLLCFVLFFQLKFIGLSDKSKKGFLLSFKIFNGQLHLLARLTDATSPF